MTKTRILLFVVAALLIVAPLSAKAFMVKAEDSTYVAKDEVISGSLFTAGSTITIDGKVQGDLFCAGQTIIVNGVVDGDVICAGQTITINGQVGGNVRAAGNSIIIAGKVARNVMVAGASVTVTPEATIAWDLQFATAMTELRGKIGRDVDGAGAIATIAGTVGRNVYLTLDDSSAQKGQTMDKPSVTVAKQASIGGDFSYRARTDASIEDGSTIKGKVSKLEYKMDDKKDNKSGDALWLRLIGIFSAILVGLILTTWLRRPMIEISNKFLTHTWSALGWGLVVLILTPIISVILLFTVIGIPLSLLLLACWLIALYVSSVITGIALGRWLMKKWRPNQAEENSLFWSMVLGVAVLWILTAIPVIGMLICFVSMLWGLGSIWQYARLKS